MPKVGLTMTEGVITQWHKQPGEWVRKGELLFTFETEKSSLEFESPAEGVLAEILVPAGQTALCLARVAVLGQRDGRRTTGDGHETADDGRRTTGDGHEPPGVIQSAAGSSLIVNRQSSIANPKSLLASPRAKAKARELGIDLDEVEGTAPEGVVVERDVLSAFEAHSRKAAAPVVKATPIAQRIASERGIDLGALQGTGPDGRITREDVERATPSPVTNHQSLSIARRVTARRMTDNARAAPHVTLTTEADATSLVSAREQLNAELGEKVSYNALLVAIVARALKEHPNLNASWDDGYVYDTSEVSNTSKAAPRIMLHDHIHIGVAVDTERGLYVPVVRDAGTKTLVQIHRDLGNLIARALGGQLSVDEMAGGTFTLTNLGMYDIDAFTPILNLPEAAILGVGRIVAKPIARGEQVVIRQMMALSLTFDHRVVDGAPAAKFLQRVKNLIERPFALMV